MLLDIEQNLRSKLLNHLSDCGISAPNNSAFECDKDRYRKAHFHQRSEKLNKNIDFVLNKWPTLSNFFASGVEVNPEKIDVRLEVVRGGTVDLTCLGWPLYIGVFQFLRGMGGD